MPPKESSRRPAQSGLNATPGFKAPRAAKPARVTDDRQLPGTVVTPPPRPTDDFIAANQPGAAVQQPVPVIGEPCDPSVQIHEAAEAAINCLRQGHPATAMRHLEALRFWASQGNPEAIAALNELSRQFADLPAPDAPDSTLTVEPPAVATATHKATRRSGGTGTRAPKTTKASPAPPPRQEGALTPTLARTGPHEPAVHAHAAAPELTEEN